MAINPILRLCDSCIHFDGDSSCSAFPKGIPLLSGDSHFEVLPDQQGDIIYEYDENRREWFEMYRRVHPEVKFPIVAGSQPEWLRVLNAEQLLTLVQASKALKEIYRQSRQSQILWERDLLPAIHRYAEFVQLMPASEAHHHAHAGGLLMHTIEMVLASMTFRNAHLLPEGSAIVAAVSHRAYQDLSVEELASKLAPGAVFIDVKAAFDANALKQAGYTVWRL